MSESPAVSAKARMLGGLWGSLVGDALGVPVEFMDRASVQLNPVNSMRAFGSHRQSAGAWSDDGALILCTADSLLNHEFNLADMGDRFVRWLDHGLWTAHGNVFDVGATTSAALQRLVDGIPAEQAGGESDRSNGNGSLMRMLPVVLRFASEPTALFAGRIEKVSSLTHRHARSKLACVFHGLLARQLLAGRQCQAALESARVEFSDRYASSPEFPHFRNLLEDNFPTLPERDIDSAGYVLHTLHASLWCLLTTDTFKDCVLKAVNLGGDTDTTGCVAGGLAGVVHGMSGIPADWLRQLPRKDDVDGLFHKFADVCEANRVTRQMPAPAC